jgi:hypothetical protein
MAGHPVRRVAGGLPVSPLDIANLLGIDLRAPTKRIRAVAREDLDPDVRPLWDDLQDTLDEGPPLMATPWPDRRIWPCTRRLFALWRFEATDQHEAAAATERSLVERGVLP